VDTRIIASTNADLQEKIAAGAFRRDLYYRLGQFAVNVPPLRERPEDKPLLAQHFVNLLAAEMSLHPPGLSPQALQLLQDHDFPGNVRELKNLIERALIESQGVEIEPEHLHFARAAAGAASQLTSVPDPGLPLNLDEAEVYLARRALAEADGNVAQAARLLDTNRNRIYRILARADHRGDG